MVGHVDERTDRLASTKMSRDFSLEDRSDATTIADLRERGSQNKPPSPRYGISPGTNERRREGAMSRLGQDAASR